jgi:transposase-like protein
MRYSNDLRLRAIKLINSGKQYIEVAKELDIGRDTLSKWSKLNIEGKLYEINNNGGHPVIYDLEGLSKFVIQFPDKTLWEINQEFFGSKASLSGINDALGKMDFRFKKKSLSSKKEMNLRE